MSRVVLRKEPDDNYGFSIADALFESGVYVKRVRQQGPADVAGVKRFDKILLVNGMPAQDANVERLLPLFDACETALELVICRYDPLIDDRQREEGIPACRGVGGKENEDGKEGNVGEEGNVSKKNPVEKAPETEKRDGGSLDSGERGSAEGGDEGERKERKIEGMTLDSKNEDGIQSLEDLRIE